MLRLIQELKAFYELMLEKGQTLNWSNRETFNVASKSIIKILALYFYFPLVMGAKNEDILIHDLIVDYIKSQHERKENTHLEKYFEALPWIKLAPPESIIVTQIALKEWRKILIKLKDYDFSPEEIFQDNPINNTRITPELLSIFAEIVLNEYEKDFVLQPKVSRRKKKGAFYSPWLIILKLVNSVITERDNFFSILDPSCGTGSFLIYSAERLFQINNFKNEPDELLVNRILNNCIYGVDTSSSSILVSKLRLAIWGFVKLTKTNLKSINISWSNIKLGNSLFGFIDLQAPSKSHLYSSFLHILDKELYSEDHWYYNPIITKSDFDRFYDKIIVDFYNNYTHKEKNELTSKIKSSLVDILDCTYLGHKIWDSMKDIEKSSHKGYHSTVKPFHWGFKFPSIIRKGGFDIIVGNPPYGRSVLSPAEKHMAKHFYASCKGKNAKKISFNSASLFLERAINLLKTNGKLAFILPFSFLRVEEYEQIRNYILEHTQIDTIFDESSAFQEVTLEMCSIVLLKKYSDQYNVSIVPKEGIGSKREIKNSVFKKYKRFMLYYDSLWEILSKNAKISVIQGDYGLDHRIVKKDLKKEWNPDEKYIIPFLHSGRSVNKFCLRPTYFHWSRGDHENPRFKKYLEKSKLICTAIGNEFRVSYKPKNMIPGTNVSVMEITKENYNPFVILSILNSKLAGYILKRYILNYSNLTVYLHKYYTKMVPIKYPHKFQDEWVTLTQNLSILAQINVTKGNKEFQKKIGVLRQISDFLVYKLYFGKKLRNSENNIEHLTKEYIKPLQFEKIFNMLLQPHLMEDFSNHIYPDLIKKSERLIINQIDKLIENGVKRELKTSQEAYEKSPYLKRILNDQSPKMITLD